MCASSAKLYVEQCCRSASALTLVRQLGLTGSRECLNTGPTSKAQAIERPRLALESDEVFIALADPDGALLLHKDASVDERGIR